MYCPSEVEKVVFKTVTRCLGYKIEVEKIKGKDNIDIILQFEERFIPNKQQVKNVENSISEFFKVPSNVTITADLGDKVNTGAMYGWKTARFLDKRK